jgi:hypothetical protein
MNELTVDIGLFLYAVRKTSKPNKNDFQTAFYIIFSFMYS